MTEEIFPNDDQYARIVERLANLEPCPCAGKITPDQIKVALGKVGDIWPAEIYGAVVAVRLEDQEKSRTMELEGHCLMTTGFKIRRDRWSLEEVWEKEGDRPGRGAFALVLDDEHLPYFRYPQSRQIADALTQAAEGQEAKPIALQDATVQVRPASNEAVRITTPAGRECQLSISEARQLARDLIEPLAQTLSGPPN